MTPSHTHKDCSTSTYVQYSSSSCLVCIFTERKTRKEPPSLSPCLSLYILFFSLHISWLILSFCNFLYCSLQEKELQKSKTETFFRLLVTESLTFVKFVFFWCSLLVFLLEVGL